MKKTTKRQLAEDVSKLKAYLVERAARNVWRFDWLNVERGITGGYSETPAQTRTERVVEAILDAGLAKPFHDGYVFLPPAEYTQLTRPADKDC